MRSIMFPMALATSLIAFACGEGTTPDAVDLYAGAELEFSLADLLKPRHEGSAEIDIYQAPLIVQEIEDLAPTARDESVLPIPVVYYGETSSSLDQHEHRQLFFVWLYSSVSDGRSVTRHEMQGLRLTLDRGGHPAVIEVLSNPGDLQLVFVSRSLEMSASRQFGGPLPGRRYAIEQSIEDQPKVVVGRVIEDGPEPMGPMVYLRAGGREVGTITCRCMPSQVQEIRESREYSLEPLEELLETRVELSWDVGRVQLREALRLPEDF